MITDVFHKRYPGFGYSSGGVSRELHVFFRQAAQILFIDLKPDLAILMTSVRKPTTIWSESLVTESMMVAIAKTLVLGRFARPMIFGTMRTGVRENSYRTVFHYLSCSSHK